MLPNSVPERRQTPRITMERLAYINIEPNNGGIVLNVSNDGLCFHSIAPVDRNGKLRFSLLEQNRRIEADGELAWMDEAQKVGGLRFSALPSEAREQIEDWINQPSSPAIGGEAHATRRQWPVSAGSVRPNWPGIAAAPVLVPDARPQTARVRLLSGFSGGLAIGLLIAGLVTLGFLLHNNRSQLGESLIQIGQRLAAKPQPQPAIAAQNPAPESTSVNASSSSSKSHVSVAQAPVPHASVAQASPREKPAPRTSDAEAIVSKSLREPLPTPLTVAKSSKPNASSQPILPPAIVSQSAGISRISSLLSDTRGTLPRLEASERMAVHAVDSGTSTAGANSRMYFEVGKFKDPSWARHATDELSHLGFPASIAQKGGLWKNSYYVLVGPFRDSVEAEVVHKDLAARGFKPRPFERGSRNFTLSSRVTLDGTDMPLGDFVIRWESYVPEAKVKFLQNDELVLSTAGRWVDRGVKNERNAFVYERKGNGAHRLLEIRFAGMTRVLVFAKPG
jgi:hypothetical protein